MSMDGFGAIMDDPRTGDFKAGHLLRKSQECEVLLGGLDRQIGEPCKDALCFQVGRLHIQILNQWIKIELLCQNQDSEAELLNPELSDKLKNWLSQAL